MFVYFLVLSVSEINYVFYVPTTLLPPYMLHSRCAILARSTLVAYKVIFFTKEVSCKVVLSCLNRTPTSSMLVDSSTHSINVTPVPEQ